MMFECRLLFFMATLAVQGCTADADTGASSRGKEFIISFLDNFVPTGGSVGDNRILVTAEKATNVRLYSSNQGWTASSSISPGQSASFSVPALYRMTPGIVQILVIYIEASEDVMVYAASVGDYSSDGTLVLPTNVLGTEYLLASFSPGPLRSQVGAAALHDGTKVDLYRPLTPNSYEVNGTVTINNGQTYSWASLTEDYTGWMIKTSRPAAVFSGHECAEVPDTQHGAAINAFVVFCSHLFEQVVPTSRLGTSYVLFPTPGRAAPAADYYRVAAELPAQVNLEMSNLTFSTGFPGHWVDFNLTAGSFERVTCSRACLVIHFVVSRWYDGIANGDPDMTIVLPEGSYSSDYVVHLEYRPTDQTQSFSSSLVMVAPVTDTVENITVNGSPVSAYGTNWTYILGGTHMGTTVSIPATGVMTVQVQSPDSSDKFLLWVYEAAFDDSISYIAGWEVPDDGESEGESQGVSIAAIGGIVAAVVVAGVVAAIVAVVVIKHKKKKRTDPYENPENGKKGKKGKKGKLEAAGVGGGKNKLPPIETPKKKKKKK